jgi:hypothetical protein
MKFSFVTLSRKYKFSRKYMFSENCHTVLFLLLCPGRPVLSGVPCQADLSRLICLGYLILSSACHDYPIPVGLSQLSCPCGHVLADLSSLSFTGCIIPFPDCLLWSPCPGWPIPIFLSRLFCPSCPVPEFFSPALLCLSTVLTVLF